MGDNTLHYINKPKQKKTSSNKLFHVKEWKFMVLFSKIRLELALQARLYLEY